MYTDEQIPYEDCYDEDVAIKEYLKLTYEEPERLCDEYEKREVNRLELLKSLKEAQYSMKTIARCTDIIPFLPSELKDAYLGFLKGSVTKNLPEKDYLKAVLEKEQEIVRAITMDKRVTVSKILSRAGYSLENVNILSDPIRRLSGVREIKYIDGLLKLSRKNLDEEQMLSYATRLRDKLYLEEDQF